MDEEIDQLQDSPSSNSPEIQMEQIYKWEISEMEMDKVLSQLKPLDMILFSGNGLLSKTIQMLEKGKLGLGTISHVALVVNRDLMPHIKEMKKGKFYIWESTSSSNMTGSKIKNIFGKTKFGVQIRDLSEVVRKYHGRVFWAKILRNPWKYRQSSDSLQTYMDRKNEIIETVAKLDKQYGKSKFNISVIDLAASVFPSIRPIRKFKKKLGSFFKKKNHFVPLFCSEFVAIIFKPLRILPEHVEPSDITPVDFLGVNSSGIPLILKKIVEIKDESNLS
jgi:hypothetical protein